MNGDTGSRVRVIENISLYSGVALLCTGVLGQDRGQLYRVSRTKGSSTFVAYAVVNDAAAPGERMGDGASLSSSP